MSNSQTVKSETAKTSPAVILKLLRPRQWTKNFIAFAPALFAKALLSPAVFVDVSVCVAALCFISGSVYVFNDILDIEADKKHPTKCNRPIASGKISVSAAFTVGCLSLVLSFLLAYLVRPALCLVILAYILLQVAYVTKLKHRVILDVFSIAAGFVLRAVAGAAAASSTSSAIVDMLGLASSPALGGAQVGASGHEILLSPWFLICTSMGALFLALEKRKAEFKFLGADAAGHRQVLGKYTPALILRMEAIIVPTLVTAYCLYSFNSTYGPWMMISVPPVLYGIMRYMVLSERDTTTGSPEEVLLKDRPIQNTVLLWVASCLAVVYGDLSTHLHNLIRFIDGLRFH
ncbi:MAG: decaprenyl-phosphate phosphoribosyltransferase [Candidatus Obscuribacter sp.]|nr:decaprenyl-phosphate phosphoribosyltransferase [Candidatus Obscuribacter sp.]